VVPSDHFSQKDWFEPLRPGVRWFYHKPRQFTNKLNIIPLASLHTVDEPLVELVSLCIRHNIPTTPSCSGHNVCPVFTKGLFNQLCADRELVRTKGMPLRHVETKEVVVWQDSTYNNKYASVEDLFSHLKQHEREGFIGLCVKSDGTEPFVLNFRVKEPSIEEQAASWRKITEGVARRLELGQLRSCYA
jgi:hypothetical protein